LLIAYSFSGNVSQSLLPGLEFVKVSVNLLDMEAMTMFSQQLELLEQDIRD